jgi:tripartite-type tricarboxylate transporter receptor subunit TctC
LGQPVVVENRPGGGSTIGTLAVAKAPPDGFTLGMIDAAFITNPSLVSKLPYDTLKDFSPIVLVATSPLVLVVHPDLAAHNVKDLISLAKANPGKLSFGSAGLGTGVHLAGEQFRAQAGLDMVHVPYKGAGQAVSELVGGQINLLFSTMTGTKGMVDAGRLRPLAITSPKRSNVMPNVPTFVESGLPGVDAGTINGLVAPVGTPAEFIQRVNAAVNRALKNPVVLAKLNEQGFAVAGGTPEEFGAWIRTEIPKWSKIIKDANIKVE